SLVLIPRSAPRKEKLVCAAIDQVVCAAKDPDEIEKCEHCLLPGEKPPCPKDTTCTPGGMNTMKGGKDPTTFCQYRKCRGNDVLLTFPTLLP
ncbi:hypothetical protein PFISCL1PPCAC_17762, partial [Pristionchus fissidentatus]